VFVVGCLGNANRAAAVLFERHSLSGHPAPRRETRQSVAPTISARTKGGGGLGTDFDCDGGCVVTAPTLRAGGNKTGGDRPSGTDVDTCDSLICMSSGQANAEIQKNVSTTLTTLTTLHEAPILAGAICKDSFSGGAGGRPEGAAAGHFIPIQNATHGNSYFCHRCGEFTGNATCEFCGLSDCTAPSATVPQYLPVAHALRGEGFDASEDGTGRGTPLVPVSIPDVGSTLTSGGNGARGRMDPVNTDLIAFYSKRNGQSAEGIAPTIRAMSANVANGGGQMAVAFESRFVRNGRGAPSDIVPPLKAQSGETGKGDAAPLLATAMQVRRLTPRECERLQGFPDDYTLITVRNKPAADGPRYKALGNSMAVPVMQWISKRIDMVEATA
jgi:DNA (cytosine-5)-methyltransferase 1